MARLLRSRHLIELATRRRLKRPAPPVKLGIFRWRTVHRDGTKGFSFSKIKSAEFGLADARRVLQDSLEDRLQIGRGRAYNPEHVRRSRLPLQALRKIACALPQFIEQPRVLDGNDGLGGEALEKLDFPVVESSYLLPVVDYCPNYFTVFEHRHHKERSHAADLRKSNNVLVGWVGSHILPYVSNLDDLFGLSRTQ
jgi:hypothetical protein